MERWRSFIPEPGRERLQAKYYLSSLLSMIYMENSPGGTVCARPAKKPPFLARLWGLSLF